MALDPLSAAVLHRMEEGMPDLLALGPVAAREAIERAVPPPPPPEPPLEIVDREAPGPGGPVPVRVYRPGSGIRPVVVFFHGGGWVVCDLDSHDALCRHLALGSGAVVVATDYRRAPEHKFPAALEDAYAVTSWVAAQADELAVDPGRLAVAGESAGGNLSAAVALVARDRGGPAICLQLLVVPVLDHAFDTASYAENAEGYFLTKAEMAWYWAQYLASPADGANPYASPLRADDLRGLPRAHVITAEHDPLRDEGEAYANRLRQAGVTTTSTRHGGTFHGFFGMDGSLPSADLASAEVRAVLAEAFG